MILSLDIGATNTRIALVDKIKIFKKTKIPTPKTKKEIERLILSLISSYLKYNPESINIAIAGYEYQNKIQGALNMDFNNFPLRKILKKFHLPVFIGNDARSACLAELNYGAGKNLKNFVLLTLGTGIGGAIVINKKLYKGNGTAGEIGSMLINNKSFEYIASGSAGKKLSHKEIGRNLGIGLSNLSYILAPEAFIIGGGFSKVKEIYPEMHKTLNKLYTIKPTPKILKAKFGDDSGLIGAALLTKF